MKAKCALCGGNKCKTRNLFNIDKDGKNILACNTCITDNLLTGWSK